MSTALEEQLGLRLEPVRAAARIHRHRRDQALEPN
jgi:hypothetical protein